MSEIHFSGWPLRVVAWAIVLCAADAEAQATGPAIEKAAANSAPASELDEHPGGASIRFDLVAGSLDRRLDQFIEQMTLAEKVGQLVQVYPEGDKLSDELTERVRNGEIGSLFYPGDRRVVKEAQRVAIAESRLGIPLLIARDVVHGLRTVFPIPLGQAATWNPGLVEKAAAVAADEARLESIDWTFAPMVDICRDARWGRIAETLGEDPRLAGQLSAAMVRGFQQERDGKIHGVVACAKHFAAYGFSEGGRDYNRVSMSQSDLRNVVLPPFKQAVDAGCRTLMTTFSEVNGFPGTAHRRLLDGVLKRDWRFSGFVVSDWASVTEMVVHGFAEDNAEAAERALLAGVDMDMCSPAYAGRLADLVRSGRVPEERVDNAVRRVLRCKVEMADRQRTHAFELLAPTSLEIAREAARQSVVLLKNAGTLPLEESGLKRVAVLGPMADAPASQLGCWSLDGRAEDSVTPLADLRKRLEGIAEVRYAAGAKNTFDGDGSRIAAAVEAARDADVALLFVGEDAVLSGEARCRATLDLPGVQSRLIREVSQTGAPTVVVFLAGRPLGIADEVEAADAVLYAWHPGTMAGPAINDLLFGEASPSGKLPVTFPRSVGQTPIYYNHANTGRPGPDNYRPLVGSDKEDLPPEFQYRSHYLDEQLGPLFPFGFGLSYATFEYGGIAVSASELPLGEDLTVSTIVTNTGDFVAEEVTQLYARDIAASTVRPVRELKGFRRVRLQPGESKRVEFRLKPSDLGYWAADGLFKIEPGRFQLWIGGDSTAELTSEFVLLGGRSADEPATRQPIPTAATGDASVR